MTNKSDIPTSIFFQAQITAQYFSDGNINCEYQPGMLRCTWARSAVGLYTNCFTATKMYRADPSEMAIKYHRVYASTYTRV